MNSHTQQSIILMSLDNGCHPILVRISAKLSTSRRNPDGRYALSGHAMTAIGNDDYVRRIWDTDGAVILRIHCCHRIRIKGAPKLWLPHKSLEKLYCYQVRETQQSSVFTASQRASAT